MSFACQVWCFATRSFCVASPFFSLSQIGFVGRQSEFENVDPFLQMLFSFSPSLSRTFPSWKGRLSIFGKVSPLLAAKKSTFYIRNNSTKKAIVVCRGLVIVRDKQATFLSKQQDCTSYRTIEMYHFLFALSLSPSGSMPQVGFIFCMLYSAQILDRFRMDTNMIF